MTVRGRHAFSAVAIVALLGGVGCAKDPTAVLVTVGADTTVPPLLILRTTVTNVDDPARRASAERSSPYASDDAADRPGPFVFPLDIPLTVDPSLAGVVVITVEGLDWDTHAVTASGVASAGVIAQGTTAASLTLAAVATGGGADGGAQD